MTIRKPTSINNIRTAIHELTARAELAHKEGRDAEGAEIERRIHGLPRRTGQASLDAETPEDAPVEHDGRDISASTRTSLTRSTTIVWSPAGMSCSIAVSIQRLVPWMNTAPLL